MLHNPRGALTPPCPRSLRRCHRRPLAPRLLRGRQPRALQGRVPKIRPLLHRLQVRHPPTPKKFWGHPWGWSLSVPVPAASRTRRNSSNSSWTGCTWRSTGRAGAPPASCRTHGDPRPWRTPKRSGEGGGEGRWGGGTPILGITHPRCRPRSDDERANQMWKRYLEREDSKIVGELWDWGCPPHVPGTPKYLGVPSLTAPCPPRSLCGAAEELPQVPGLRLPLHHLRGVLRPLAAHPKGRTDKNPSDPPQKPLRPPQIPLTPP